MPIAKLKLVSTGEEAQRPKRRDSGEGSRRPAGERQDSKSVAVRERARALAKNVARSAAAALSEKPTSRDVGAEVRADQIRDRTDGSQLARGMVEASGQRTDTWKNELTKLGVYLQDKRLFGKHQSDRMVDLEAEDIWRGDDMASRAVETVPEHIRRAGWELLIQQNAVTARKDSRERRQERLDAGGIDWSKFEKSLFRMLAAKVDKRDIVATIQRRFEREAARKRGDIATSVFPEQGASEELQDSKELIEQMEEKSKALDLDTIYTEAMKAERAYGGAAIFPGINDGVNDLSKPLDWKRIKSIDWMDLLTPLELIPYQWYADPTDRQFGQPELYWMQRISIGNIGASVRVPIHASRIIHFPGIVVSRRQLREHWGWGDSILLRMKEVLRDFQTCWQGTAILITEFAQAVMSIDGLVESFASGESGLLQARAQAFMEGLSIARTAIIDSKEKYERQQTPVTGLADLLDRFGLRLSAAARMPYTVLMGESPGGLNATGKSEIRNFYDDIGAYRDRKLDPRLRRGYRMIFRSKEGPSRGVEPDKWSVKYGALWQATEDEVAAARLKNAQADDYYIKNGSLLPEEVAKSRFGGDEYGTEIQLDPDIRQEHDEQVQAEAEAEAARMQMQAEQAAANAAAKAPPPGGSGPGGEGGKSGEGGPGGAAAGGSGKGGSPAPGAAPAAPKVPKQPPEIAAAIPQARPRVKKKKPKSKAGAKTPEEGAPAVTATENGGPNGAPKLTTGSERGGKGGTKAPTQPVNPVVPPAKDNSPRTPGPEAYGDVPVGSRQGPTSV